MRYHNNIELVKSQLVFSGAKSQPVADAGKFAFWFDQANNLMKVSVDGGGYTVLANLAGVTATAAEINKSAGVTGGTVTASKTLVTDANKDLASLRNLSLTGTLTGDLWGVGVKTADYPVVAADSGKIFTNEGAGGAVVFTLPVAALGLHFHFYVMAAQALRIDENGTETIALPSTGAQGAGGKYIGCSTVGAFVDVWCVKTGQWETSVGRGTWVSEA